MVEKLKALTTTTILFPISIKLNVAFFKIYHFFLLNTHLLVKLISLHQRIFILVFVHSLTFAFLLHTENNNKKIIDIESECSMRC